jgi:hypothetical protein
VGADVVVDVVLAEDWLCAASSACIVAGEICAPARKPVATGPELADVDAAPGSRNGCPKPVDCEDEEDVDEASAWMASMALDAAPKANNMVNSETRRPKRHTRSRVIWQQAPCHGEKPNEIAAF